MENNKNPLRILYIVQLITIVILVLLLIQNVLPFFGITPIGTGTQNQPIQKIAPNVGFTYPEKQQAHGLDSVSLDLVLFPQIVVQNV